MLNTDNDAPVAHSFSDGKIAEMVSNTDKHEDDDNDDGDKIVNTWKNPHTQYGENVWSVNTVAQCAFVCQQKTMAV